MILIAKKINSRNKGRRGEQELAKELRSYGYAEARRGQQFSGSNGDADVVGIPKVHIEVKRTEALNLDAAMEQSISDAREGEIPVVVHRKNRKPWKVTQLLPDWMEMTKDWRDKNE